MVHFPELALSFLCIRKVVYRVPPFGNRRVYGSVLLTVAYRSFHVLHRLKVPRHSPHALSSLTIKLVHKQSLQTNDHYLFNCLHFTFFMQLVVFLHVFSCQTSEKNPPTRTLISARGLPIKVLLKLYSYTLDSGHVNGGDDRSRTCDPLNANQMLSQLSYIPILLRRPPPDLAKDWLRGQDSNLRPLGYEPNELPGCSTPRQTCGGPG